MKRIIEHTEDGSATLFVPELNEHYHSVKGARTESQHIFIDMGLKASAAPQPHVLEIGFGTGLKPCLHWKRRTKKSAPYTIPVLNFILLPGKKLMHWDIVTTRYLSSYILHRGKKM